MLEIFAGCKDLHATPPTTTVPNRSSQDADAIGAARLGGLRYLRVLPFWLCFLSVFVALW
jgi:hypothetical protein